MHELLKQLMEERARDLAGIRTFHDEAEARKDGGKWTAEDLQEWQRRNESIDELDKRIETIKNLDQGERQLDELRSQHEAAIRPTGAPDEGLSEDEKRAAAYFKGEGGRSLEISLRGLRVERVGHRNVVRDLESRVLTDGTATAGGNTFGTSFRALLYQHLVFNSAIRQTNATVLTTESGENLILPKTTQHPANGTIVSEGGLLNESDPAFGQGTLSAYKYGNLIQVSSELEQDTAVDLLGYIAKAAARSISNGAGNAFVTGTGTSQPQGVLVGAGTIAQVVGGTPAANGATFVELTKLYDKIIPAYQVNAEWFMSQSALQNIRALTNTQGTPIFLQSLSGDQPSTLFGKSVIVDPFMPAVAVGGTSIAFGDFSSYFIRDVQGVRFERSVDYAFGNDLNTYRVILRTDGRLLDLTGAIANYKGGTA